MLLVFPDNLGLIHNAKNCEKLKTLFAFRTHKSILLLVENVP